MKKIRFYLYIIKIYMKNQMQDKTNLLLDIFNTNENKLLPLANIKGSFNAHEMV